MERKKENCILVLKKEELKKILKYNSKCNNIIKKKDLK